LQFPKKAAAPKQNPAAFSAEDKQELQNVKQLCLTVMKGQKRLVREVGLVKDSVERNATAELDPEDSTAGVASYKEHEVTIHDIKEIECNQRRSLKAHLIALDMKERGEWKLDSRSEVWNKRMLTITMSALLQNFQKSNASIRARNGE
jgi:hypothetical protein